MLLGAVNKKYNEDIMLVKLFSFGILSLSVVQKIPSVAVKRNALLMQRFVGVLYLFV